MENATMQNEAIQWYSKRGIPAFVDDAGEVYITTNGEDIYLAVSEVDYRGNMFLDEEKNSLSSQLGYMVEHLREQAYSESHIQGIIKGDYDYISKGVVHKHNELRRLMYEINSLSNDTNWEN